MPIFEYKCKLCGYLFEELVRDGNDFNIPCKKCGSDSEKQVSQFSSSVNGGSSNETIDITIGREANKRWQRYYDRQSKRRGKKKLEEISLPKGQDGKYTPVMALGGKDDRTRRKDYVGALKDHRKSREKRGQPQFSGPGEF